MESAKQGHSDIISFPVLIHQTESAYYLKIGNDENKPEDFSICLEDGRLIISSKEKWQKKSLKRKAKPFLHTVKGTQVETPHSTKYKRKINLKISETIKTLKSVLFTI